MTVKGAVTILGFASSVIRVLFDHMDPPMRIWQP